MVKVVKEMPKCRRLNVATSDREYHIEPRAVVA